MAKSHYFKRLLMVSSLAALLSGCAGLGTDNRPADVVVSERAEAWVQALLAGDYRAAYEYTTPGYRQFSSAGSYHARVAGTALWKTAEVDSVICEETLCNVRFIVEYPGYRNSGDVRRPRDYRWIQSEGRWWLYVAP